MKKAFIFDLDGVIINDEPRWDAFKANYYPKAFGHDVFIQLGQTMGSNLDTIYNTAHKLGAKIKKKDFLKDFRDEALKIYHTAPLTQGLTELANVLIKNDYYIGVVSASPQEWVNIALNRLSFKENISILISLYARNDLQHKPSPDGYNEAIKLLHSSPENTIILEDSNAGIQSAKAAGAFTIGLQQNLFPGYVQKGADAYAKDLQEVIRIIN